MRSLLAIFLLSKLSQVSLLAGEPTTEDEMLRAADFIAIVAIQEVRPPLVRHKPPEHGVMNASIGQEADATVERALRGELPARLTISHRISYPAAFGDPKYAFLQPGNCLVFLTRHGRLYSLLTPHSHWPIKDAQINWFGKALPVEDVVQQFAPFKQ